MKEHWKKTFMDIAETIAKKSTCLKSQVGSIAIKDGRIISIGYNGTAPGEIHCIDKWKDDKENFEKYHTEWSRNNEIHSEINLILFAAKNGISLNGCDLFVTMSPCIDCAKAIYTVGIKNVYYKEEFRVSDGLKYLKKRIYVEQIN